MYFGLFVLFLHYKSIIFIYMVITYQKDIVYIVYNKYF